MTYPVEDIPQGCAHGLNCSFSEGQDTLGLTEVGISIDGDVVGDLTLWREGAFVTIDGNISAIVAVQCSRCLTRAMESLHQVVRLRCLPEESTNDDVLDSGEVKPEDDIYSYNGLSLDLRPIIREQLVLAVPPYSYCRQDCQGLCSSCGQNLNDFRCGCSATQPDARFVALQQLHIKLG